MNPFKELKDCLSKEFCGNTLIFSLLLVIILLVIYTIIFNLIRFCHLEHVYRRQQAALSSSCTSSCREEERDTQPSAPQQSVRHSLLAIAWTRRRRTCWQRRQSRRSTRRTSWAPSAEATARTTDWPWNHKKSGPSTESLKNAGSSLITASLRNIRVVGVEKNKIKYRTILKSKFKINIVSDSCGEIQLCNDSALKTSSLSSSASSSSSSKRRTITREEVFLCEMWLEEVNIRTIYLWYTTEPTRWVVPANN